MLHQLSLNSAAIRSEPSHRSEMVNQLLFGESFTVLEESGSWSKIRSNHDAYTGWMETTIVQSSLQQSYKQDRILTTTFYSDRLNTLLSPGSFIDKNDPESLSCHFPNSEFTISEALNLISKNFLNVPYLWGGRTVFGVDCSGLSQLFLRFCGLNIMRDASEQSDMGLTIPFEELKLGDLLFFHNDKYKIVHVAIVFSTTKVIHASGKVHLANFDQQGIYIHSNSYTHNFAFAKRLLNTI
ncbi:MAG TPA: NlpC/P60 family protein [Saprospiraceae bacterium]|nr:NlpC/P60 family protein [Saprospiraceae bacterium]